MKIYSKIGRDQRFVFVQIFL